MYNINNSKGRAKFVSVLLVGDKYCSRLRIDMYCIGSRAEDADKTSHTAVTIFTISSWDEEKEIK